MVLEIVIRRNTEWSRFLPIVMIGVGAIQFLLDSYIERICRSTLNSTKFALYEARVIFRSSSRII